jgi:hypothetical protein
LEKEITRLERVIVNRLIHDASEDVGRFDALPWRIAMTHEQQTALRNLVRYVLDAEEQHHEEAILQFEIEHDESDPHPLKSLPYFPHIFRDAFALKELAL